MILNLTGTDLTREQMIMGYRDLPELPQGQGGHRDAVEKWLFRETGEAKERACKAHEALKFMFQRMWSMRDIDTFLLGHSEAENELASLLEGEGSRVIRAGTWL